MRRAVLVVAVLFSVFWAPMRSQTGAARIASACAADERVVMVFSEGHAWRQTWLVLTNVGETPATAYYESPAFWGGAYMTALAPGQRTEIPIWQLVYQQTTSFTVQVWSSTNAVVAAVTSWDTAYTVPCVSPMVLVCRS
jgi:hypothetical protein